MSQYTEGTITSEYEKELQLILLNSPRDKEGRLLAPNGNPTNLTERQYAQVRTKAFKDWFGEWENDPKNASKVVDENGEPLVVYHGGSSAKIFNTKGGQFGAGIKKGDIGTYFTTSKSNAKFYEEIYTFKSEEKWIELDDLIREGLLNDEDKKKMDEAWEIEKPSTRAFFLNIRNPKITNYEGTRKKGYTKKDSNIGDNDGQHIIISDANYSEYVVFNPNQIKSATDNVGTFSKTNNRVDQYTEGKVGDASSVKFDWDYKANNNYEVSSKKGDERFSAFNAIFKEGTIIDGVNVGGKSIEDVYQHIVKKSEKGQAPAKDSRLYNEALKTKEEREDFSYTEGYLPLWQEWAKQNPGLIEDLRKKAKGKTLTDKFANTRVNQARALADILN